MNNTSNLARLRTMINVATAMAMASLALFIFITIWGAIASFYHANNLPTLDGKIIYVTVVFGWKLWLQVIFMLLLYVASKLIHLFLDMYEAVMKEKLERQG